MKKIKRIIVLVLNIIIITLILSSLRLEKIHGLSFVAATLGNACNNYILQTDNICKKLPLNDARPGTKRTQAEESLAECCSNIAGGNGPQEYCWAATAPGYCTGTSCTCHSEKANPPSGYYGVASENDCALNKYYNGLCYYELPCGYETGACPSGTYCWRKTAPAYCTGTSCTCQSNQANPQSGESYGVRLSSDCYATANWAGGKCWFQVPEVVIGWDYNQNLKPEQTANVFVREEKVWFLDSKGYLIPAKIMIKVW